MTELDTIAAIATPPGQGGVGIVRISGKHAQSICESVIGKTLTPRYAHYGEFLDENAEALDTGIAIYFKAPHSFTGEDILELQGHGGPMVLDLLLKHVISLGARAARAGEFSERAFLNDKIDLTQAEAIADLISAESHEAARAAVHSLQGDFSSSVHHLVESLIQLRIHVEATLDFPEEEIDFLADKVITEKLEKIQTNLQQVKKDAKQGRLLKEGMIVVIAGKPNAGKSSLLNQLAGIDSAIVTDIPGTTRDILKEHIQIDGLPLHIIDTAGLRESDDVVEQEGIKRALNAINTSDRLLYILSDQDDVLDEALLEQLPEKTAVSYIHNKIDIHSKKSCVVEKNNETHVYLSAKTGEGIDLLRTHLKQCMGFEQRTEGKFIARRRHLEAIDQADKHLELAEYNLKKLAAGELVAEELLQAQQSLSSITGEFSNDDLLGRIFSDFCIGK